MQLIGLYSFSSTSIFVHLPYIFKWNGSLMVFSIILLKRWGDFTEKVKTAMLTALSIEHKKISAPVCYFPKSVYSSHLPWKG